MYAFIPHLKERVFPLENHKKSYFNYFTTYLAVFRCKSRASQLISNRVKP